MADEYYNNKIVTTDGDVLMDLTQDTATPETVLEGETFHLRSGAPAVGTYRPSDEIEARLEATVGHSSKNLSPITLESGTYTTGGANLTYTVDKAAGTITFNGNTKPTGGGAGYIYFSIPDSVSGDLYLSGGYSDKLYIRARDNTAGGYCKRWDGSDTSGSKGETDSEPVKLVSGHTNVLRILFAEDQTFTNAIVRPMLRSGSISDDTFEPYVMPTDEKKQDKPVVLWEAALNSTGVSEVAISSLSDDVSNYSCLKVVVTNELGTTITDQTVVQTDVEYDVSYIGQDVARSTGGMLGFHEVDGRLVFDRLFVWVLSDGTNVTVIGLRDHDDSIGPPDTVPGLFIRRIIGIPK